MVGVGGVGKDERSVLARASVVNYHGEQLYDSFVKPREAVTNWRTSVSGVTPDHMVSGMLMVLLQWWLLQGVIESVVRVVKC